MSDSSFSLVGFVSSAAPALPAAQPGSADAAGHATAVTYVSTPQPNNYVEDDESESDPGASSEATEMRPAPLSLDSKTLFRHWGQILLVFTSQGSMHLA